jgi:hypothetical protein
MINRKMILTATSLALLDIIALVYLCYITVSCGFGTIMTLILAAVGAIFAVDAYHAFKFIKAALKSK